MENHDFEDYRLLLNSQPRDEFMGLSPAEMNDLLYHPLGPHCAVQVKHQIEDTVLDQLPFFRLTEALLSIIAREGFIKLTPLGFLNRKTLQELYELKIFPDSLVEKGLTTLNREPYWYVMITCRETATFAGLIRKSKGKLFLTNASKTNLIKGDRTMLFRTVLTTFMLRYNWSANDRLAEMNILQKSAAYCMYMLHKCGNKFQPANFYSDNLLAAYPKLPEIIRIIDGETNINYLHRAFALRFFERFTQWFAFTEAVGTDSFTSKEVRKYKTTPFFDAVFAFES